jgi:cyclopropane fatty-acyl-phospholipid synthase-like methyltransferase
MRSTCRNALMAAETPAEDLSRALVETTGGPAPLLVRARRALREDDSPLALELADVVLRACPHNAAALRIRERASQRLEEASETSGGAQGADDLRELQDETARAVNRWYDRRMYLPRPTHRFAESGFHNYGYWTKDIRTQVEACEKLMEMLLALIPQKVGTILDVACGKGGTTRFLLNYYDPEAVTGINISAKQLETCRSLARGCTFLQMSATDLRFPADWFDNIICVEAAHHFVTRETFIGEAHRVLAPGGRLVLSDIVPTRPKAVQRDVSPRHGPLEPDEYRDLYTAAGFERVEVVDATEECIIGFRRHTLRLLRRRLRRGAIDEATFQRRQARQLRRERRAGNSYVLVCAQKRASAE